MFSAPALLAAIMLAQSPAPPVKILTDEPVSVAVALIGTVVVASGFGMMLHANDRGESDTGWLIGGVAVMSAGVTLTYLGLRSRTVTITPVVGKHVIGGVLVLPLHRVKQ